jgi:ferredoxin
MPNIPDLVRPSTRAFIREARRTVGYSWFDLVHGYVYGRWCYLYIKIGTGEHRLTPLVRTLGQLFVRIRRPFASADKSRPTMADNYHGKVVSLDAARQLVSVKQDISMTDLEQVIPYPCAREIVLQNPDHIVVLECPCRSARANPCLPLDVCLTIGEPFASFILEHHPQRARQISPEEAEGILTEVRQRGHVSHAFFKDAMFGRFYAICNCCSCCCGAMQAHRNGTPMLASSGYVAEVVEEQCQGCGTCVSLCQFGALTLAPHGVVVVDRIACMGCGVCEYHCPHGAISLQRDRTRGQPLDLARLIQDQAPCV